MTGGPFAAFLCFFGGGGAELVGTELLVAGKTVGMEIGLGGLVETIGDDLGGGGFN